MIFRLAKREFREMIFRFVFDSVAKKLCFGCVFSERETPVPIPNTEVKPLCGDGTAVLTVGE